MLKSITLTQKQKGITTLLLGLLIGAGHLPVVIDSLLFYLVLLSVALLAHVRGRAFAFILGGSAIFYALAWMNSFHDASYNILFCVSGLICLWYGVQSNIHFVLSSRHVSLGEVFALVNCYLLMGYFWALLYSLVQGFNPGAFLIQDHKGESVMNVLIYFSFTTMTTLGYGDVLPQSILAQRLSVVQAIYGQFYFALVVAYLLNKLFQQQATIRSRAEALARRQEREALAPSQEE